MTTSLKTPLWDWHIAHGAKMAPFAGWDMPIQYKGIVAEHTHTRGKVSVFDICHMAEFVIKGPGAGEALAKAVTINIATLKPQHCRYGFMLNESGGVIDDLIVYHIEADHYMLVVNAACREDDFAAVKAHISGGITLTDESDRLGKIDIQGPKTVEVLERILPGPWRQMPYFTLTRTEFAGVPLLASRTGYTGELGFELYVPMEKTLALWEACLADNDVEPAGLGARDTLRLEAGLPLYGQDLDTSHTPAEAGYDAMLTSKAEYVGKANAMNVREKLIALSIA